MAVAGTRGGEGGREEVRMEAVRNGDADVLRPGQGKDGEPLCRLWLQIGILRKKFHVEMLSHASTK